MWDEQVGRSPTSPRSEPTWGEEALAGWAFLPARWVRRRPGAGGAGAGGAGNEEPGTRPAPDSRLCHRRPASARLASARPRRLAGRSRPLLPDASPGGPVRASPAPLVCAVLPPPKIPASFFYLVWKEAGLARAYAHNYITSLLRFTRTVSQRPRSVSTDVPPSSRMEACGHQHPAEPARTPKSLLNMSVQGLVTSRTTRRHLSGGNRTCKGPTLWKMLVRRAGESLGYAGERGRGSGDRRPTRPRTKTTQGCLAAAWDHGVTCLTHKLRYDFRQNVCFSRSVRENEKTEHGKTKRNEMLSKSL